MALGVAISDEGHTGGPKQEVAAGIILAITPVNDAPVIGGDKAITVAEGGAVVVTTADLTATDPDNTDTQLVYTVTGTSHGNVRLNGAAASTFTQDDIAHNRVSFLHDGGELDGSFTVSLSDGAASGGSATVAAIVNPHVNDAPVVGNVTLPSIEINSGAHLITAAQLLANTTDVDSSALTITDLHIDKGRARCVANGNQTWTYTPKVNDDSDASFAFTVSDGQAAVNGQAKLDITASQAAPEIGTQGDDTFTAGKPNSAYNGGGGIDTIIFDFKLTDATITFVGQPGHRSTGLRAARSSPASRSSSSPTAR